MPLYIILSTRYINAGSSDFGDVKISWYACR